MLSLDSPRWSQLKAAGGNPSLVTGLIRSLVLSPSKHDWDEVWEQVSHQWTAYPIAFAALPHLIQLGIEQGIAKSPEFLLGLGRTVDSLARLGDPPADLEADFAAALRQVAPIVQAVSVTPGFSREDYLCVLHAAAALSGRCGLGTELFFSLYASDPELDCPSCEADLSGAFEDGGLTFQNLNSHMQPLSEKARVQSKVFNSGSADDRDNDFEWLVGLCRAARQEELLGQVCLLYGEMACPLCGAVINVMTEMMRGNNETSEEE